MWHGMYVCGTAKCAVQDQQDSGVAEFSELILIFIFVDLGPQKPT